MSRTFQIMATITIRDLDEDKRTELASEVGLSENELPRINEIEGYELKSILNESGPLLNEVMWSGTGHYAELESFKIKVIDEVVA